MAASNSADTEFQMHARSLEHINNIIDDLGGVRTVVSAIATLFGGLLEGSKTFDAGSIADGDEEVTEVTVTGAALGDYVIGASLSIDVADLALVGAVTATDTVTAQLLNNTGGAIDLASATLRVLVLDRSVFLATLSALPSLLASKT